MTAKENLERYCWIFQLWRKKGAAKGGFRRDGTWLCLACFVLECCVWQKTGVAGLNVRWPVDRITRRACDPSGLHGFYMKVNTSTGSEVGVTLSEFFLQGDIDWHYYLCAVIFLNVSWVGWWIKLDGHQQHKPLKKYLKQCTRAGACSVAWDVGDRLCAFCLSLFFRSHFSNEHWCAVGSAEHAGSSASLLSDMITHGTCSCFMLILEACFTGSSQNVENNYVVNAEILLQCLQSYLWCWKSCTLCLCETLL